MTAGRTPAVDARDGWTRKWLRMVTAGRSAVADSVRVVYDAVAAVVSGETCFPTLRKLTTLDVQAVVGWTNRLPRLEVVAYCRDAQSGSTIVIDVTVGLSLVGEAQAEDAKRQTLLLLRLPLCRATTAGTWQEWILWRPQG